MKKILLVEDDKALREATTAFLEAEGFRVLTAENGEEGLRLATKENPDLLLLDLVLPALGGLEVCQKLRLNKMATPIIILTGQKKEEVDKVLGLELGADDYLIKPFGQRELLARIHALLRRSRPEPSEIEEFAFDEIEINFKKRTALKAGREFALTAKEFGLLRLLIQHEGEVVSREMILNEVWGYDKYPTTRTVDTFIHNLRHKIENDPSSPRHLLTIPWQGYKFQK